MSNKNLLPAPLSARAVRSYINFDGGAGIDLDGSDHAKLQSKGVAALWHLLMANGFAYLADEVGMGKTRQANAVIASQFLLKPDSRIVVICPGAPLQEQWLNEWNTFMRNCYKARENRLLSTITGQPLHTMAMHSALSEFACSLLLGDSRIHLLRYSSFSRPINFPHYKENGGNRLKPVRDKYVASLQEVGIDTLNQQESALLYGPSDGSVQWYDNLTGALAACYVDHIGKLLVHAGIDLIVADEAQYLRRTHNQHNSAIAQLFRNRGAKWLFLSATPLHSCQEDIQSLDIYLCRQPQGYTTKAACGDCDYTQTCTRAAFQMSALGGGRDVIDLLGEFMVRRPRIYKDGNQPPRVHGKTAYRSYRRVATSAKDDPFLALAMALVQKKLVRVLQGQGNRFQQGECSSFESLSTSIARSGNQQELEYHGRKRQDEQPSTIDRDFITKINASFRQTMGIEAGAQHTSNPKFNLPHAKLNQCCDALYEASLRRGIYHKTLVFTRRLDTVDEMVLLLRARFQDDLDRRIDTWRTLLHQKGHATKKQWPAAGHEFWSIRVDQGRTAGAGAPTAGTTDAGTQALDERSDTLAYFRAIRDTTGKQPKRGMLVTFRERLIEAPQTNPLGGFLATGSHAADEKYHPAAHAQWVTLLKSLLDQPEDRPLARQHWLCASAPQGDDAWRQATLKRCLLQSLRHSDFLVDLYILHNFGGAIPCMHKVDLADKLIWLLSASTANTLPATLNDYVGQWRNRLRDWIIHFDLIVEKCLRRDGAQRWDQVYANVDGSFARMAPVMGRSGRLEHRHAVTQFNFPSYPNILVCTDVLKEGVDMHLFCDHVVHYGVAWTSGDLEQRIGRIDRLGSLISRRIGNFNQPGTRQLPRLSVEFPYLEGTLDQYQVERVMLEKVRSDRRLDLGKNAKDCGEITIDQLDRQYDNLQHESSSREYPDSVRSLLDMEDGAALVHLTHGDMPHVDPSSRHLPELDALAISAQVKDNDIHARSTDKRRKPASRYAQYLVAIAGSSARPACPPLQALASGCPQAVCLLPFHHTFHFDFDSGTMLRRVPIIDGHTLQPKTPQPVWLERLQDFLLLRTPLAHEATECNGPGLISQSSQEYPVGHLMRDNGTLWLVCFLLDTRDSKAGSILDKVSWQLAATASRVRQLHYRSRPCELPSFRAAVRLADICASYAAKLPTDVNFSMTSNTDSLQAYGQLLASTQQWFSGVFAIVLDKLSGGMPPLPSLMTLMPDGVLHLQAEGVRRHPQDGGRPYKIEAFLQLAPTTQTDAVCSAPRMIWQITANKYTGARGPALWLCEWNDLPHNQPMGWSEIAGKDGVLFHDKAGKRRNLILYHAPGRWDARPEEMATPWESILNKLTGEGLQAKHAANAFFKALGA